MCESYSSPVPSLTSSSRVFPMWLNTQNKIRSSRVFPMWLNTQNKIPSLGQSGETLHLIFVVTVYRPTVLVSSIDRLFASLIKRFYFLFKKKKKFLLLGLKVTWNYFLIILKFSYYLNILFN
jgi:hypothetical protein